VGLFLELEMPRIDFKVIVNTLATLGFMVAASVAQAQSQYVGPLNAGFGNGASVSCGACHQGATNGGTAVLPMASTWRSGANLALSDSDGDGFNNAQEVNGGSSNFNYASVSPFISAKAAESSTSTKVVVTGAGIVTETTITDIYAQTGIAAPAAGSEIVANVSPLVPTFPATITFTVGVPSGSKVYAVNFANQSNTLLTTGITYNTNGSITVSGVAANTNIVVERVIPVVPAAGAARGGGDEEGEGCMTSGISPMLLMFLSLLTLAFITRRGQLK